MPMIWQILPFAAILHQEQLSLSLKHACMSRSLSNSELLNLLQSANFFERHISVQAPQDHINELHPVEETSFRPYIFQSRATASQSIDENFAEKLSWNDTWPPPFKKKLCYAWRGLARFAKASRTLIFLVEGLWIAQPLIFLPPVKILLCLFSLIQNYFG